MDDKLTELWSIIGNKKDVDGRVHKERLSLKRTNSDIDYENLRLAYNAKTRSQNSSVFSELDKVINELSGTYITREHISCISPSRAEPVLCIHYRKPPFFETPYCLAIPGISYITKKSKS